MVTPSSNAISDGDVFQNAVYVGINLENILYGIELLLYFRTIRVLLSRDRSRRRFNVFYALFSSMMLFLVTVWVATQAIFGEKMWLINSQFPGGPNSYWEQNISIWYMDWGTTAVVILQLMTDALMIYRCWIICNNYSVTIVLIILWLATLALGFLVDWTSSLPGGDFYTGLSSQFGLAYYSVSVVLHFILTCMICFRLVRHGREVQKYLGRQHATLYFAIVSIIIESVTPYTLSGIAFVATLGVTSSTSVAFGCVYFMMMSITSQLLILRVLSGRAWNQETFFLPGSMVRFSTGSVLESQGFDSNQAATVEQHELQVLPKVYLPDGDGKV